MVIWKYKFMLFCHLHVARTTKIHLYSWCMRNCDGDPDRRRAMIMTVSNHLHAGVCMFVRGSVNY